MRGALENLQSLGARVTGPARACENFPQPSLNDLLFRQLVTAFESLGISYPKFGARSLNNREYAVGILQSQGNGFFHQHGLA